ncbi:MAG: S9 family peptidase, partial [Planctomycetota bacterium JB042]
ERLSDWPTAPHLWHVVLASGVRRRLAEPGDRVQDAFAFLGDGRRLVVLTNRPIEARPWFETDVRTVDLRTGAETPVASLRMGFENRPGLSGFAASPDGTRIAFVGPPSELGDDVDVEPNAFDPDLYVLDLGTAAWTNVTADLAASVAGHVRWTTDGTGLRFLATEGARNVIVSARLDGIEVLALEAGSAGAERVHDVDFAGASSFAAVVSRSDRLPWLVADGRDLLLPNRPLERRWALPEPVDQSFAADDGTPIEAWLFRPVPSARGAGKLPLVVYYYGGATPSLRGWNELHAFVVANGYALYVVNPRGANGYGRAFADHHVNDWGEKAGADILRGVADVLARNDDLDPRRVGGFGGSYGGFMTMSLLTKTDRFAAAVSLYGISNLASYFGDGQWGWTYGDQAMARSYPWSHAGWYAEHSPLFHADRITTPLLLLHGAEDGNVPPAESEQMFTALRLLNRPVELVRFSGEDHGLRGTWENRVAHREMMVDWFDRHLRGRPEAWEARWE